jgi:hypothetical protein
MENFFFDVLLPWTLVGALILGTSIFIICVTIELASSGLPKVKESLKEQKDKLLFWLYFYLLAYWVASIFGLLCDPAIYAEMVNMGNMTEDKVTETTEFCLLLAIIISIISWIGLYHFVVRLWSQIPKNIARITPQKAAWFSLIPIFNFYGWFVTFCGLLKNMNKTAQQYGQPVFVTSKFAVGICIFWIVSSVADLLKGFLMPQGVFSVILSLAFLLVNLIFTTAFFIYLYKNVIRLIALESYVSPINVTMSDRCHFHSNQKTLVKAIAKVTFRFGVWFISSLAILPALVFMFAALDSPSEVAVGCMGLFIFTCVLSGIFSILFLYTVWELIPPDIARTTPGKAILFMFIPIFVFYWQFVAIYGLGKDLNRALEQAGSRVQVNQTAGLLICLASFMPWIPMIGSAIALISLVIFGTVYMFSLQNGAVELLTIQRENNERFSNQQQHENQINDDKQNRVMFWSDVDHFVIHVLR